MKIVAFDLGSTMGWAANFKPVGSGYRTFTGSRVERLLAIQQWLLKFQWTRADIVVYETPLVRGQGATRMLWGIAALLEAAATGATLPILDVAVPTIKKFATGSGNAPKDAMLVAAAKKFGYTGADEHEADAICLLHYAITNLERGV
jgi:Holliday junction resolvasome RuvABC endonuclease subunit